MPNDWERGMEDIIAELRDLTNADHFEQVEKPRFMAQLKFIIANRTVYPYAQGEADLKEYIAYWEQDPKTKNTAGMERSSELYHKLIRYGIIPDDVAIKSKQLSEERLWGPSVPQVVSFAQQKVKDTILNATDQNGDHAN